MNHHRQPTIIKTIRLRSEHQTSKTNSFDRKTTNASASNFIAKTAFSLFEYFSRQNQNHKEENQKIPTNHPPPLISKSINQAIIDTHSRILRSNKTHSSLVHPTFQSTHQPVASCRLETTVIA
jgi:hypothetical protein